MPSSDLTRAFRSAANAGGKKAAKPRPAEKKAPFAIEAADVVRGAPMPSPRVPWWEASRRNATGEQKSPHAHLPPLLTSPPTARSTRSAPVQCSLSPPQLEMVITFHHFLNSQRADFINSNRHVESRASTMTEEERDAVEKDSNSFITTCHGRVRRLVADFDEERLVHRAALQQCQGLFTDPVVLVDRAVEGLRVVDGVAVAGHEMRG